MAETAYTYDGIRSELLGRFEGRMNVRWGMIAAENGLYEMFLDLACDDNPKVGFRAAWTLDWLYKHHRHSVEPFARRIMEDFIVTNNSSVQRVYSKLTANMVRRGTLELSGDNSARLAEKAFDLLISNETPVAVAVWCMDILLILRSDQRWIDDNFEDILRTRMDSCDATPAYISRATKTLRLLTKHKL